MQIYNVISHNHSFLSVRIVACFAHIFLLSNLCCTWKTLYTIVYFEHLAQCSHLLDLICSLSMPNKQCGYRIENMAIYKLLLKYIHIFFYISIEFWLQICVADASGPCDWLFTSCWWRVELGQEVIRGTNLKIPF